MRIWYEWKLANKVHCWEVEKEYSLHHHRCQIIKIIKIHLKPLGLEEMEFKIHNLLSIRSDRFETIWFRWSHRKPIQNSMIVSQIVSVTERENNLEKQWLKYEIFHWPVSLDCRSKSMVLSLNFTEPFRGVVSVGRSSYKTYGQKQECALRGDGSRSYSLQIFHNRCQTRFDVNFFVTMISVFNRFVD